MKAVFVLLLTISFGWCSDWPDYRGPNRDGVVTAGKLQGTFGFEVAWKRELGSGYSAISLVDGKGVTMFSDETSDILTAFDAKTGKEMWRTLFGPVYKGHSGSQDGPTSTPVIDDNHVFALDPHGVLVCVNLNDGQEVWKHKLGDDLPARVPHYGFATVPLVLKDRVIVMTGDGEGRTFTALHRTNGELLWTSGSDTGTYQTPILWQDKVLAVTDNNLMALDPESGKVLWQSEHKVLDNESYTVPVFHGTDGVVISTTREGAYFKLSFNDQGEGALTEVWRGDVFGRTYAIPMPHGDAIYGFKARFLSAINPADGSVNWRSRPPSGKALTLMDGHLLTISDDGDLVAVACNPNEYREIARIKVFDQDSYTPVSYANGMLYARNLKELAAIRITDKAMPVVKAAPETPEFMGVFGQWVQSLAEAQNAAEQAEKKWNEIKTTPLIEGDLVHYLAYGDFADLGLARGFEEEKPLYQVPGTKLFVLTEKLDPASHWEYHFSVFGDPQLDAKNPFVVGEGRRARNELRMPQWTVPSHLEPPTGPVGRVEEQSLKSDLLQADMTFKVYLPAGYDESDGSYPLIVNTNDQALSIGLMDRSLDNLFKNKKAVVAFLPTLSGDHAGDQRASYAQFLAEELVPYLNKTYRLKDQAKDRSIMGVGRGAVMSTYAALKQPNSFGTVINQSFVFFGDMGTDLRAILGETQSTNLRFFVEVSSNDYNFPGIQAEADSRALIEMLSQKDAKMKVIETAGAPSWSHWRSSLEAILDWALASPESSSM